MSLDAELQRVDELLVRGSRGDALAAVKALCRQYPDEMVVFHRLGILSFEAGDVNGGLQALERAVTLAPRNPSVLNDLGAALQMQHRLSEAEAVLRRAANVQPPYPPAHFNLGRVLLEQGRPGMAVAALKPLVQIAPDMAPVHWLLSRALKQLREDKSAESHFREALRLEPDNTQGRFQLAELLQWQDRQMEAIVELDHCLRVEPTHRQALILKGLCHQELGDKDASLSAYRSVLRLEPALYYRVVKTIIGGRRGQFILRRSRLRHLLLS